MSRREGARTRHGGVGSRRTGSTACAANTRRHAAPQTETGAHGCQMRRSANPSSAAEAAHPSAVRLAPTRPWEAPVNACARARAPQRSRCRADQRLVRQGRVRAPCAFWHQLCASAHSLALALCTTDLTQQAHMNDGPHVQRQAPPIKFKLPIPPLSIPPKVTSPPHASYRAVCTLRPSGLRTACIQARGPPSALSPQPPPAHSIQHQEALAGF